MTTLRIAGVPEPYNLPWHLAMERSAFAGAGIDLHWHTVPEGTGRMCQMLRDGELDLAVLVTEGAVRDILNGGPHRIVSTFVESPLPWGVHVPAGSSLHASSDLKGIPFAISRPGSGSHLMAMLYAQRLGWMPSEKDLVVVNNMEGAAERMSEGGPLVFLWEKFVTARYVEAGIMRRVDEIQGDWPGFVIVARNDIVERGSPALERLLRVLQEEVGHLRPDARSVQLVMINADLDQELATAWLKNVRWHLGTPPKAQLDHLRQTLHDLGLAPR